MGLAGAGVPITVEVPILVEVWTGAEVGLDPQLAIAKAATATSSRCEKRRNNIDADLC